MRRIGNPSDMDAVRSQYGKKQDGTLFCSLASSGDLSYAILEALMEWVKHCVQEGYYKRERENATAEAGLPNVRPAEGASEPMLQLVRSDRNGSKKYNFAYGSHTIEESLIGSHAPEQSVTSTYIDLASEAGESMRLTCQKTQVGNSEPSCEFRQEGRLDLREFVSDIAGATDARTGHQFELIVFYLEADGRFWCQLVARR